MDNLESKKGGESPPFKTMKRFLSYLLYPLGLSYANLVALRNKLNQKKKYSLGLPTISIGNISAGGTGKTPFTCYLARKLKSWGENPFILSRGYKAKPPFYPYLVKPTDSPTISGDEPLLLTKKGFPVIIDPKRQRAAKFALQKYKPTLFLLDDGFQQTKLQKELDLVLFSPKDFYRWNRPFPSGYWREGEKALKRAHIFLVNLQATPKHKITSLALNKLKKFNKPLFFFDYKIQYLEQVKTKIKQSSLRNYLLITTIANPQKVVRSLINFGLEKPVLHLAYKDHYFFTKKDTEKILNIVKKQNLNILCTEKDRDKIMSLLDYPKLWVIKSEIIFNKKQEEEQFLTHIKNLLRNFKNEKSK